MSIHKQIQTYGKYTHRARHWCSKSERFTGGDSLLSALRDGWKVLDDTIKQKQFWLHGTRPVTVYYIRMQKGRVRRTMPVIRNPFVMRLFQQAGIDVYSEQPIAQVASV